MSDNADAVRDHLNAAHQYAKALNRPMLCYLVEMAILENEGDDTGVIEDEAPPCSKPETNHSTTEIRSNA